MITVKNAVLIIQAIALLLLSLYLLFLFIASGHRLNFGDFAQIKLVLEIFIFFVTAIALFFKNKNVLFGDLVLISLLILVQIALIDFYIETSEVEYGDEGPVVFFILFFLLFASNLFLIYVQIIDNKRSRRPNLPHSVGNR